MPQCRVFGCSTHVGDKTLSSHRFPSRDPATCQKWLIACRIQWQGSLKTKKYKNMYVCSRHFKDSDFERDFFSEIMMEEGEINKPRPRKLKEGVVPTLCLHDQAVVKPRLAYEKRQQKQRRQAQKRVSNSVNQIFFPFV